MTFFGYWPSLIACAYPLSAGGRGKVAYQKITSNSTNNNSKFLKAIFFTLYSFDIFNFHADALILVVMSRNLVSNLIHRLKDVVSSTANCYPMQSFAVFNSFIKERFSSKLNNTQLLKAGRKCSANDLEMKKSTSRL